MCWQDVQIARQQTLVTTQTGSVGSAVNLTYQTNLRRTRLLFSCFIDAPGNSNAVKLQIYRGVAAIASNRIVSQCIVNPFDFSLYLVGQIITGQLFVALSGNGIDSDWQVSEYELTDHMDYGNPILHPPKV